MKMLNLKCTLTALVFLFIQISGLFAQTSEKQEKLVMVLKKLSLPISMDPPRYFVEIRNDTTIHFYSEIPEKYKTDRDARKRGYIEYSYTNPLTVKDYQNLENTILEMNLDSLAKPKRKQPEGDVVAFKSGVAYPQYFIKTSIRATTVFSGYSPYKEPSDSAKILIKMIDELEKKYKPREHSEKSVY